MSFTSLFGFGLADVLTPSLRLALPYVTHAVNVGLSTNQIQSALTAGGLGVRRQDLLNAIRVLRSVTDATQTIRGLKADVLPPANLIKPSLGFQRNVYQYRYLVRGVDPVTGESGFQYITVGRDTPLSLKDAEAAAMEIAAGNFDKYVLIADSAEFQQATIDPRFLP